MTITAVISELSRLGVSVSCAAPGALKLSCDQGDVPPEAIELAKQHKADLIAMVSAKSCLPHNDPAFFVDQPAPGRPGWIRTTCRQCGKFIGYQPCSRNQAQPSDVEGTQ